MKTASIDSSTDTSKVTLTQTDAWTPGTDAVQGGDNEGDGEGEGDNTETEVVASGKISVATVDLGAGKDTKLDAAAVTAWNEANGEEKGYTYANVRISTTPDTTGVMQLNAGDGLYILADKVPAEEGAGNTNATTNGYINTGIQNVTNYDAGSKPQLANAAVDFDAAGAWQDGAQITIGDTTYTVAVGADSKFKDVKNVIDLTDQTAGAVDAKTAAKRLTAAAANSGIFTVGHDGTGKTTLQQKSSVKDTTDMTTKEKFASYLGISTPDSIDGAVAGKGLTLQIGDTSDSYNQLKVSIGDMHTSALGIADLNIGNQADAAAAIQTIRNAINYVSGVRGDLGATQNRLEHTENNLSVMKENIQDAESTIRDTDVAEEMMSYVKNNILVQSAQAMLAQANQVPQGVLQLLG